MILKERLLEVFRIFWGDFGWTLRIGSTLITIMVELRSQNERLIIKWATCSRTIHIFKSQWFNWRKVRFWIDLRRTDQKCYFSWFPSVILPIESHLFSIQYLRWSNFKISQPVPRWLGALRVICSRKFHKNITLKKAQVTARSFYGQVSASE